jgi:hypothetical protein
MWGGEAILPRAGLEYELLTWSIEPLAYTYVVTSCIFKAGQSCSADLESRTLAEGRY